MKTLFTVLLAMLVTTSLFAGARIESWKDGEGLRYVQRDDKGLFEGWGTLYLESWNDGDSTSEWVARKGDGTFVTGYKGKVEKFKVAKKSKEQQRLVVRNSKGQFVTWKAMDEYFDCGFSRWDVDRDGDRETVYACRYQGKFVNWAPAKLESWANYADDVLVVRDSSDDGNNGKLMAWVAPEYVERSGKTYVIYRDPATGQFVSPNK